MLPSARIRNSILSTALYNPLYRLVVAPYKSRSHLFRKALFRAAARAPAMLLHCNAGGEEYLVDSRDKVISQSLFVTGSYDFEKFELAIRLLKQFGSIGDDIHLIDIGSNVGSVCIPAVNRGTVKSATAIEPNPNNCRLLRVNIALNGLCDKVSVIECALGNGSSSYLEMELADANSGDHRIRTSSDVGPMGEHQRRTISVSCRTLDELGALDPSVAPFIWMDVQGYEGFVLEGARAWLQSRTPFGVEFWPYGMKRSSSYARLKRAFADYRGFVDLNSNTAPGQLRPIEELDHLHDELGEDGLFTDLLFIG